MWRDWSGSSCTVLLNVMGCPLLTEEMVGLRPRVESLTLSAPQDFAKLRNIQLLHMKGNPLNRKDLDSKIYIQRCGRSPEAACRLSRAVCRAQQQQRSGLRTQWRQRGA